MSKISILLLKHFQTLFEKAEIVKKLRVKVEANILEGKH